MALIKCIYSLVKAEDCWFKEYTNTMNLNAGLNRYNTDGYVLYRVNDIGTDIVIAYKYGTLVIGDKSALVDTVECIKK